MKAQNRMRRINIKSLILALLLLGCAYYFFVTWWESDTKTHKNQILFGIEYNSKREEIKLPKIESDWIIQASDSSFNWWTNSSKKVVSQKPIHLWKKSNIQGSVLASEEDVFHFEGDDKIAYRLIINYSLLNADSTKSRMVLYDKEGWPPTYGFFVSQQYADSVLRAWGFKYYDFQSSR